MEDCKCSKTVDDAIKELNKNKKLKKKVN